MRRTQTFKQHNYLHANTKIRCDEHPPQGRAVINFGQDEEKRCCRHNQGKKCGKTYS